VAVAIAEEKSSTTNDPFRATPEQKQPAKTEQPHRTASPIHTGQAAIEKALNESTSVEFKETPLTDVIDFLINQSHIEIQLDQRAIADVGIGTDTPMTAKITGVSLRSVLNLILRPINLTWIIKDEVLLITTPEEAESQLTIQVHDVSDLVVCRDKNDDLWNDYDTLIDTINRVVKPTTWDNVGGPGEIVGVELGSAKVLVVNQTYAVHREIEKLLADIRAVAAEHPDEDSPRRERKPTPSNPTPQNLAQPDAGHGMGMF
jgi:hypothetical protein